MKPEMPPAKYKLSKWVQLCASEMKPPPDCKPEEAEMWLTPLVSLEIDLDRLRIEFVPIWGIRSNIRQDDLTDFRKRIEILFANQEDKICITQTLNSIIIEEMPL